MPAATSTPLQNKQWKKEDVSDTRVNVFNKGTNPVTTPLGTTIQPSGEAVITVTEWEEIPAEKRTAYSLELDADYGAKVETGGKITDGGDEDMKVSAEAITIRKANGEVIDAAANADNIEISAAPSAGNKRVDVVYFDLGTKEFKVAKGTAVANASTATPATVPQGGVPMANVAVASSVTKIVAANITDVRPRA